jgi:hypothetical protein
LEGFSVKFAKNANGQVDPLDTYLSDWVGEVGGNAGGEVGETGVFYVGNHGSRHPTSGLVSLGLVKLDPWKS